MAYLQHNSWKDRPGAIAGVIAIHALVGYALVTGLTFTGIIKTVDNPDGIFVEPMPLPPPPPPPDPIPTVEPDTQLVTPPMHQPMPPIDVGPKRPPVDSTAEVVPVPEPSPFIIPKPTPQPGIEPRPLFEPSPARPKGNSGLWVTVDDYRSSWIAQEKTGTVRFSLDVGASGRVENCTIITSSGHPELDAATCKLVTNRARFDPAKDSSGATVRGGYSNSVRWELPE